MYGFSVGKLILFLKGKKVSEQPHMVLYGNPPRWHKFDPALHVPGSWLHSVHQASHEKAVKQLMKQHDKFHALPVDHQKSAIEAQVKENNLQGYRNVWRIKLVEGTPAQKAEHAAVMMLSPEKMVPFLVDAYTKMHAAGHTDAPQFADAVASLGDAKASFDKLLAEKGLSYAGSPANHKDAALQTAIDHLKEDSQQGDIPASEKKEDAALVDKLEDAKAKPVAAADAPDLGGPTADTPVPPSIKKTLEGMAKKGDKGGLEAVIANNPHNPHFVAYAQELLGKVNEAIAKVSPVKPAEPVESPAPAGIPSIPAGLEYGHQGTAEYVKGKLDAGDFDEAFLASLKEGVKDHVFGGGKSNKLMAGFMSAAVAYIESKLSKAPNDGAEDWMSALFGESSGSASAESGATPKIDPASLTSALSSMEASAQANLENWQSKEYKANKTKIHLRGDGPSKQESMSIGAINAGKKQKAIAAANQEISVIHKLQAQASTPAGAQKLAALIESTMQDAKTFIANGTMHVAKTVDEAFEYLLLEKLGIKPDVGGYTSHPISQALLKLANGETAPTQPTADNGGPKEGDTKPGADGGTLVLKDGHWVRNGSGDAPSATSRAKTRDNRIQPKKPLQGDAFKKWFADSKAVDSNGQPLVVYHGTTSDFSSFDSSKLKSSSKHDASDFGFFASVNPNVASTFAGRFFDWDTMSSGYKEGAQLLPLFVSIQNPFVITANEFTRRFFLNKESPSDFKKQLKKKGFDGILIQADKDVAAKVHKEFEHDSWVAFHPSQLKSALGNGFGDPAEGASKDVPDGGTPPAPNPPQPPADTSGPKVGDKLKNSHEVSKLPPGSVVEFMHGDKPAKALIGHGHVWFAKFKGKGWQKNPLTPQQLGWFKNGNYCKDGATVTQVGDGSFVSEWQQKFVPEVLASKLKNGEGDVGVYRHGSALYVGVIGKPDSFTWVGEDHGQWGLGLSPGQAKMLETGEGLTQVSSFDAPQPSTDAAPQANEAPSEAPQSAGGSGWHTTSFKHTKTGADQFAVPIPVKLGDADYKAMAALAKEHGGHYSSYKAGGAVAGFLFKTEAQAHEFAAKAGAVHPVGAAAPTAAPTEAPTDAPATVAKFGTSTYEKNAAGKWVNQSTGAITVGFQKLSLNLLAGDYSGGAFANSDKGLALDYADKFGHGKLDPIKALNGLFPPGPNVKEGDTKTINGVTYILKNGRWHKMGEEPAKADKPAAADEPVAAPVEAAPEQPAKSSGKALTEFEVNSLKVATAGYSGADYKLYLLPAAMAGDVDAIKKWKADHVGVQPGTHELADKILNAMGAGAPAPVASDTKANEVVATVDDLDVPSFPLPSHQHFFTSLKNAVKDDPKNLGITVSPKNVTITNKKTGTKAKYPNPLVYPQLKESSKQAIAFAFGLKALSGGNPHAGVTEWLGQNGHPVAGIKGGQPVVKKKVIFSPPGGGEPAKKYAQAMNQAVKTVSLAEVLDSGIPAIDGWEKTGGQKGSNTGGFYKDSDGQEWYCKFPDSEDHVKNELLAGKLYEAVGIKVPQIKKVRLGGKLGIASKVIGGLKKDADALKSSADMAAGFAADCWLANWDVVGLAFDNALKGPDGSVYRIDPGGALLFRAQGTPKGDAFGDHISEFDTLLDPKKNSQSALVFGGLTHDQIKDSVKSVLLLKDSAIEKLCQAYGPGDAAAREALAKKLIARKHDLALKFPDVADEVKPKIEVKIAPAPNFKHWNDDGSGLSSKPHINDDNQMLADQMQALAQSGDVAALENFHFQPIGYADGKPVGSPEHIQQHKSKHIKTYWQDLINNLKNPIEVVSHLKDVAVETVGGVFSTIIDLFDDVKSLVEAPVRIGRYALLGMIDGDPFESWKIKELSHNNGKISNQELYDLSQKSYAKLTGIQKQAIKQYTGSGYGSMNNAATGVGTHGNTDYAISGIDKASIPLKPGTVLSRKFPFQNEDDLKKFLESEGGIVKDFGMISTATTPHTWSGTVHLRIVCGEGVKGLFVAPDPSIKDKIKSKASAISMNPGENEVILPYGTKFFVRKVHPVGTKFKDEHGSWGTGGPVVELVALPNS